MSERFNPLLDKKRPLPKSLTASDRSGPPPSPFGGAPMTPAVCRDTPVYVDMVNRIVVPILKNR
jgi:hypothetical protein